MTDLRQAAQQALEALESSRIFVTTREKTKHPEGTEWYDSAITALREALAQPEQEPVACRFCHSKKGCWTWQCYHCGEIDDVQQPTPPAAQRPWVGLTDDDIHKSDPCPHTMFDQQRIDFARTVEAKLKERNT